ncbi:MAG: hypothetical protein AABN34_25480 [Acidobacteriota bacterium]
MNLVLIETSGNQQYIFATNKLRENVGASELTYRVGTEWVLGAVHGLLKDTDPSVRPLWDEDVQQLRENLLNRDLNPPITNTGVSTEVIVATSGKAMLLVENAESGKKIIREVTCRALKDAPGLDVCGIVSDDFDWKARPLGEIVSETHRQLDQKRENRPGSTLRFLRLPVVMECATSGMPAAEWDERKKGEEPSAARSAVSLKKRKGSESYGPRMKKLLRLKQIAGDFARNIGVLEKYCDWLAVVHADGNGVGQIFLDFWKNSGCEARQEEGEASEKLNRDYVETYRKFSIALDVCTQEAFIIALQNMLKWKNKLRSLRRIKENRGDVLPILPILLGGDDLTVVCDGQAALQFTHDFLVEFEQQTARPDLPLGLDDIIPKIAAAAPSVNANRLSACAGLAIVKPHFPFSAAYDLSEQLITSAKQMKPRSALDFHALYDASGSDLDRIRQKLRVDEGKTLLYGRPYVVTSRGDLPIGNEADYRHDWQKLEARIEAIFKKDDDGRRRLPNSQLHDLRGGLFLGEKAADARYRLIRQRYKEQGITTFDEAGEGGRQSLFFTENGGRHTRLLDALDAANFWVETDEENENGQNKEDAR